MSVTRFPSRAEGLADRMAGFIAHLRMNGLRLGPGETVAALAALSEVEASAPDQARRALKALLVPDAEGWRRFDDLFDGYWFNAGKKRQGQANTHVRVQSAKPALWQTHLGDDGAEQDGDAGQPDGGDGEAEGIDGRLIATRTEALSRRDLRELMDEDSLRAAEKAARQLARALRDRRSRRRRQAARGQELDLRRVIRASLARGGEPLDLPRRRRLDRPLRIVALCDVSGSMSTVSRVFLAFLRGLIGTDTRADAYLFHTRLMRVTEALRDHDTLRAAGRLSLMAEGFGGGTDIGGALRSFNEGYASRAVNGRTVVVILSDGYCTGAPEEVAEGLRRLQRRAHRVIWLNPLNGWQAHAPVAQAMAAARPHLDALLPANTIAALAALEPEFARL
ncbi:vWA domain-containing protein [Antarctobacter sp.]|uniref:vWA domain-containing protein n=1 Tax=Antarctobacter sp. TaxID=1872577 RepID=UPI002B2738DB|nr:VWA domain-containing protein [Antarctobacter sp.]